VIDIVEAYRFVWAELQKRPSFWLGIALAAIVAGNIGLIAPLVGGVAIFILAVGLMNVSLRAVHNLNYGIEDLVVQPETYLEICISLAFLIVYFIALVMAANFLAAHVTLLQISAFKAVKVALGATLLGWFLLKVAFVPYYILDRKLGAAASIVESWRDSNMIKLKAVCVVLLIALPFYILKAITDWSIDLSLLVELLQALAVGHLWGKYMNYKAQVIKETGRQTYRLTSQALIKRVYTVLSASIAVSAILILL
jgi:hypothetical protein